MFDRFARERDPARERMDDWTRETVDPLAAELGARAVYPFDTPPPPFLTWARKGGGGHVSPLGLNIHPVFGLWHAYRAALLFAADPALPDPPAGASPCTDCIGRPCLTSCPVEAFRDGRYDVIACARHVDGPHGQPCASQGCLARRACPAGRAYVYGPAQASFHMNAFIRARRRSGACCDRLDATDR